MTRNGRAATLATLALATFIGCYHRREVPRGDWAAIPQDHSITVRTLDGSAREFNGFVFTTGGLSAWRRGAAADSLQHVDSTLIPLDSIAVVRVSEFNRGGTMLLLAAATTATFIVLSQAQSDVRPEPIPRPPSSCPFVYSFDGEQYVFDSETYAGAVARGLERTDVDNLDHARAVNGRYRFRVTNERPETDYTDEFALLVVDHPRGTRALPDVTGAVHVAGAGIRPLRVEAYGGDTIPSRAGWELSFARPRAQTESRSGRDTLALIVRARNSSLAPFVIHHTLSLLGSGVYGWYASMRTQLMTRTVVRSWMETEGWLHVQAAAGSGAWRTVARLPDVGAAIAKDHVVLLDMSGATGDTVRVRLESSPGLWILESAELAEYAGPATVLAQRPVSAVDERGGDVSALLEARDGKYLVTTRGSVVTLDYAAPPLPAGMTRSLLARTTGHYYMETDDRATPRTDIVERLLRDRAFSQGYFADAWARAGGAPLLRRQ